MAKCEQPLFKNKLKFHHSRLHLAGMVFASWGLGGFRSEIEEKSVSGCFNF